jgi:hypothetical protein
MKTLIILNMLLGAACAAFGQGEIIFANAGVGVDAPVTNAAGNRILGPGPYVADFFWSSNTNASMDSLSAWGINSPFYNNPAQAGYFVGRVITLPGVSGGAPFWRKFGSGIPPTARLTSKPGTVAGSLAFRTSCWCVPTPLQVEARTL